MRRPGFVYHIDSLLFIIIIIIGRVIKNNTSMNILNSFSFIELKLTYQKIHSFQVYDVIMIMFIELCEHHYTIVFNISITPKRTLISLSSQTLLPTAAPDNH